MAQTLASFKYDRSAGGMLRIRALVAHSGWLRYSNADGSVRWEFLSEDALFDPQHLDSVASSPVTLFHPSGKITPENYKELAVGSGSIKLIGNRQRGELSVILSVGDAEAIASIESGKTRSVSCGYDVQTVQRADGHFEQQQRVNNHIALCTLGRASKAALSYT